MGHTSGWMPLFSMHLFAAFRGNEGMKGEMINRSWAVLLSKELVMNSRAGEVEVVAKAHVRYGIRIIIKILI